MADISAEPGMSVAFQVVYDGDADAHDMDVQVLAPALLAFGDIIRAANVELNGDRSKVQLLVASDFEHKCFNIKFQLVMTLYEQIKTLLKLDDVNTAQQILIWLGIFGVTPAGGCGLLKYLKVRKGRQIKSVTRLDSPDKRGLVSLEFADGAKVEKIEIHNHVYNLGENKEVVKAVAKAIQPIKDDEPYKRLEFRENGKPQNLIDRSDAGDIQKSCDAVLAAAPIADSQLVDAVLQIRSPVFDIAATNWSFYYGDLHITVDISDTDIAQQAIDRGGAAIRDTYVVKMQISQHVTFTGRIGNRYKILEVKEFIPAENISDNQGDLFKYLGTPHSQNPS